MFKGVLYMKKNTRAKMMKGFVVFAVLMFLASLLPMMIGR
jgi:hypothetical protein